MTTRKIVKLVQPPRGDRSESLTLLKEMTRRVKAGEINSVAVGYVCADMSIGTRHSEGMAGPLLGSVQLLVHRLSNSVDKSDD